MKASLFAVTMLIAALAAHGAVFSFSSSFEGGSTEGWTVQTFGYVPPGGTGPVAPLAGGVGNTGYLETEDTMDGFLFFIAPAAWSGDLYGGTLSFWLRNQNPNNYRDNGYFGDPVVWVKGSGGPDLFAVGLPGATAQWTYNQVQFSSGFAWAKNTAGSVLATPAEIAATLAGVTQIGILGDWVSGFFGKLPPQYDFGHDITGLDEVLLENPIPEPATAVLVTVGLALAGLRRRRG